MRGEAHHGKLGQGATLSLLQHVRCTSPSLQAVHPASLETQASGCAPAPHLHLKAQDEGVHKVGGALQVARIGRIGCCLDLNLRAESQHKDVMIVAPTRLLERV
jgi:hypothetical protein